MERVPPIGFERVAASAPRAGNTDARQNATSGIGITRDNVEGVDRVGEVAQIAGRRLRTVNYSKC